MGLFSEYCGLGKSSGPAEHAVDAACKEHDEAYEEIIKKNKNPYFHFNQADEDFIRRVDATVPEGRREALVKWAALAVFKFKKAVAPHSAKNLDGEKWLKEVNNMPGLGGFGHQTEKERKASRLKKAKEDALALIATGQVELDASGKITGNKHNLGGDLVRHGDEESFPDLPAIENGDLEGELDELLNEDWTPDSEFIDEDDVKDMEVDSGPGGEPEAAARVASGPGGPVTKETPVLLNAKPSYGLQETHTALCVFNGWLSAVALDHTAIKTDFRVTSPIDCMTTTLGTTAASGAWTKGLKNVPLNGGSGTRGAAPAVFPVETVSVAHATEQANWFAFWAKIYEYYTVLSCEYEIILQNPNTAAGSDALVGYDFNSYSDTAGATGNQTPDTSTLIDMKSWKHIRWERVEPSSGNNTKMGFSTIRGTYRPGQAARNISNDGDVKTWTSTLAGAQPTLKEFLTLYYFKHPMNTVETTTTTGVNVQYTLKYIVQFKDLRVNARYPKTGVTDISMTTSSDVMQIP